ncbi:MAG: PQQ-binding-like beta-propeller repeat protein [Candidatus Nealsonbacteria bacterium]|nr:PQQ-binding-like beta-propeller repeat protein [Candidatus Nealsonbacteria bacterium]
MRKYNQRLAGLALLCAAAVATTAVGADRPQWGQAYSRNMVSDETNLSTTFDPETGENVRWSAALGTETNSTPVVARGKVIIGTNNGQPRDPRHDGHRGVLLCLDEKTGNLCWQLVVPRLEDPKYLDWRTGGICSVATVQGDRVYVVSNRAEVICLDLHGQADGNDGPYTDEGRHTAPADEPPAKVTPIDADIVWMFDMPAELGVHPHDATCSSILIDGPHLYLNTSNGVDRVHRGIPAPDAPSLIVLDKETGRLVAQDGEQIGPRIFHCTWSSPSLGTVDGERRIFFGGGDGVCYGFKPLGSKQSAGPVKTLERTWRFDCDPTAPKENVHRYMRNRSESPSTIMGMPVFYNNRIYVTGGGDIWWGKRQAWVKCIDATGTGLIWSRPVDDHCCSTPAICDGLVFVTDYGRNVHCLDAETGTPYWVQETRGAILSSPLVADGKVYVGTKGRNLWVFAAEKQKKVLATIDLGSPIIATPVAANGTLYVATMKKLYAVGKPAK